MRVEHVGSPWQHNAVETGRVNVKPLPVHSNHQLAKRNLAFKRNTRSDSNRNLIRVEARVKGDVGVMADSVRVDNLSKSIVGITVYLFLG